MPITFLPIDRHHLAETYQSAKGELVDRLLAVLEAAEGEGGDIRGRQSCRKSASFCVL